MADQTDMELALFTPADTPVLPSHLVTTTPFTSAFYPTQVESTPTLGLAGELRGFYASDRWRPKFSRFMFERQPGYFHGGVDIFAPRSTPLVAMIAGECDQLTNSDPMGKRVHLRFTYAGVKYRFILGHLDRFEGAPRSVNKGDVVGYAGCSGNAGGSQPCLSPNRCGKYSTHLHLQMMRDSDLQRLDPLKALQWNLFYGDDERDILCDELLT